MKKKQFLGALILFATAVLLNLLEVRAQVPNVGYVYPAGGQTGTTTTHIIGGMNLRGVEDVYISGEGVAIKSVKFARPFDNLSNDLKNEIRPILEAIDKGEDPIAVSKQSSENIISRLKRQYEKERDKKDGDAPQKGLKPKTANAFEEMLDIVPGERLVYINKTPEEVVKIIKELPPLEYQCLCKAVFTKPNVLQASPAIEQNVIIELAIAKDATPGIRELRVYSQAGASNPLVFVIDQIAETVAPYFIEREKHLIREIAEFPCIANGQIMPGEIDRFKFKAKAGEKYAFSLMGRKLVPYLGDAVPGWFQPIMSVHGDKGKLLEFADDNLFDPDPVIGFIAPADGEYEVRIRDSIYRGREDFVYRLKAERGSPPQIGFKKLELDYEIATIHESESNDSLFHAQKVEYPVLIEGAIANPADTDCFRIKAVKGEKLVAEIFARRLDSPLDSLIQIIKNEKIVFWNDDWNWLKVGTQTHQSDSYCFYEILEDGEYFIKIADAQSKGGPKFRYKLRIDHPRPDFQVFMNPSVLNTRPGAPMPFAFHESRGSSLPFTLQLFRADGFDLPINIHLANGPQGVKIEGNEIPPGVASITMTIFTPEGLDHGLHKIELSAKAKIGNKEVSRMVVPTDDVMQAFLYRHLVPAENLLLFVAHRFSLPFTKLPAKISLKSGEEQEVSFPCAGYKMKNNVGYFFELYSPPQGISITKGAFQGANYVFTIRADAEMKPWKGNLVFQCLPENQNQKKLRTLLGFLPAIPAEVK